MTRACIALTLVLICVGIGLRLADVSNVGPVTPDENTYAWQANLIRDNGPNGSLVLADYYRQHPEILGVYGTPARLGYVWLLTQTMAASGTTDERAGRYLSCIASIASLLLVALIAWRFFGPQVMLFSVFFFAFYPLELAIARRAWVDSFAELLALSLIYIAGEITRGSRRPAWFVLFGLIGGVSFATKEIPFMAFGVCALWIAWILLAERRRRDALLLAACCLIGVGTSVLWVAFSVGGLRSLAGFYLGSVEGMATLAYVREFESGPLYALLQGFWIASPFVSLFGIAGLASAFRRPGGDAQRNGESRIDLGLALFVLAFLALPMVTHRLNLRYICVAFGPLCLLGGLGFACVYDASVKRLDASRQQVAIYVAAATLLASAILGYSTFQRLFVIGNLPDLSIKMILDPASSGASPAPQTDSGVTGTDETAVAAQLAQDQPTPENHLGLSLAYHRAGRYLDSIASANEALRLRPDYPEALNNIAAANEALGQWDAAIVAAKAALKLKPDFQLAKNNLAYSEEQKKLATGGTPVPPPKH